MEKIEKIDIAKELIESALGHYFETQQYFASIQCAGAAEEILGRYVKEYGGVPAYEKMNKSIRQVSKILNGKESSIKSVSYVINYAKNSTKHMDNNEDDTIVIDPQDEANELLNRAVTNYYFLMDYLNLDETENIKRFNRERI